MTETRERQYVPSEIATLMAVHYSTVMKWIGDGVLPAVNMAAKKGRPTYRVHRNRLETFLKERGWTEKEIQVALN